MKYPRQIWNSIAQDYDIIWEVPDYTPILWSIIEKAEIDLGQKVLDVGTGTGMVCIDVAKKVGERGLVLGIDFSKQMLKQALKKTRELGLNNIDFVLADAHNLPCADRCFDAVTSCFTFAFLFDPREVANEMVRVLGSFGRVAFVEWERPPVDFWAEARKEAGIRDFLESELIKILHDSGFRKIRTERIQVLYRRPCVSDELVKKSQLVTARLMRTKEDDAEEFFSKIREEYSKIPSEKKRGWLPVLYVGQKY